MHKTHRARLLDSTNIVIGADTDAPGDIEHPIVRVWCYDDLRDALVDLGRYVVACNAMHRSQERRQVLS